MNVTLLQDQIETNGDLAFARQRISPRTTAVLPVTIRISGEEHVGVLRDISRAGMFFYSGMTPAVGSELEVVIKASEFDPRVTACCRCRVVRVEVHRRGAATGVGVAIASYEDTDTLADACPELAASYKPC